MLRTARVDAVSDDLKRSGMRIVHVVGGLAPDQRFGGISRVAVDLARMQRERGHQVHLISSDVGFAAPHPPSIEGVPVTLLNSVHPVPSLGFGTIFSPQIVLAVLRFARRADVVHVHVAREPNTLLAARTAQLMGVPMVLQTHGMIDAPSNALARVVDVLLTRPVIRNAPVALTLTRQEDAEVRRLSGARTPAVRFTNGIDVQSSAEDGRDREVVLFLSRLHPRKGARAFASAAATVSVDRPDLRFVLVGPDEGDGPAVQEVADASDGRIRYVGPVAHHEVAARMASAALYCLPAEREPFGLTVLEAMAASTPVLLHSTSELADLVREAEAGWTFGGDRGGLNGLADVMRDALADDGELRRRGQNARKTVVDRFSLDTVVRRLDDVYRDLRR